MTGVATCPVYRRIVEAVNLNHWGGLTAMGGRSMLRHGLTAITPSSPAARMMDEVRL
ncbi:hypothetical protein [Streptomyces bauhiniae]|uniref:hypothetical protein n=1 Tax=Streptomyces bauhiniae TaxID=2340725 RepID=UPI003661BBDB